MAIRSGFFNSVNGDRKYDASRFAEYFASFIGNGVFPNPSDCLQVISNNDMTITVRPGKAWINGYILINDDDYILEIEPADGALNRIDRIVARYDVVDREIRLEVKKGTFASNPVAPELQRDADAYELGLADIYVGNGVISISQSAIIDLRLNTELCGIVHGVVEQVDTTTLFAQYQAWYQQATGQAETDIEAIKQQFQAEFDAWFAGVKDILDESTAGNLFNLIEEHKNDTNNPHNITPQQIGAASQEDFDAHKADYEQHKADYEQHKADLMYQIAGGTATAIILDMQPLTDGYAKTFIASANNNSAATTINGKPLYKPNTTSAPNLVAGKAYTVWYNQTSDCFFIKASAEGTASVGHVLAGETFSNDEDTGLVGTMVNQGQKIITPTTTNIAIPKGFHDGTGYVEGNVNLKPENIKNGVNVFGVIGNLIPITPNAGTIPLYSKTGVVFSDDSNTVLTYKGYIEFSHAGTYRVRYTTYGEDVWYDEPRHQYAVPVSQLYLNGSPLTERRENTSYSKQTWTSTHTVSAGDRIEFYLCKKQHAGAAYVVYIENVQVLIDRTYPTVTLGK